MKNFNGFFQWVNVQLFFMVSIVFSVMFGIYASSITKTLDINPAQFGRLAGTFFVFFAVVQFYSGKLFVKMPTKILLFVSALIAALGSFLLATTSSLALLYVARILLGIGLATTYVGVLYIVQKDFEAKNFSIMSSLSLCLANLGGTFCAFFGSMIVAQLSYQKFFVVLAIAFLVCSVLILLFVKNSTESATGSKNNTSLLSDLKIILKNSQVWWASIFFAGLFGVVLSFGDLFSTSYQTNGFNMTLEDATKITSMILLGVTIGSFLAGVIANKLNNYALTARVFAFIGLITFCIVLFVRFPQNYAMFFSLLIYFILGFGLSGAVLAFQCIQENVAEKNLRPLATSFVLTVTYIFVGFIEQPIIGQILNSIQVNATNEAMDLVKQNVLINFNIHDGFYRYSLSLCFALIALVLGVIASLRLKTNVNGV